MRTVILKREGKNDVTVNISELTDDMVTYGDMSPEIMNKIVSCIKLDNIDELTITTCPKYEKELYTTRKIFKNTSLLALIASILGALLTMGCTITMLAILFAGLVLNMASFGIADYVILFSMTTASMFGFAAMIFNIKNIIKTRRAIIADVRLYEKVKRNECNRE